MAFFECRGTDFHASGRKNKKPKAVSLRAAGNGGVAISNGNLIHSKYQRISETLYSKYFLGWHGSFGLSNVHPCILRLPRLVEAQATIFHFPQAENSICALASSLPTKAIRLCGDPLRLAMTNRRVSTVLLNRNHC